MSNLETTDAGTSILGPVVPILVVDDNPAKRLALKSVLAPLGYSIVEADSGIEALRCVMVQDFAVILLDVMMPIMGGFETAAMIRQRRQAEMTPIIFITAFAKDEIGVVDRYAQGAVDFIFAPVAPSELRAKVSVFANLFTRASELAHTARLVATSAEQLRVLTDAAPIGIFQTDANNAYVYTNPRWSQITGISAEDAVGSAWDTIMNVSERSTLRAEIGDGEQPAELCHRFELAVPDGPHRIVIVTSTPMPSDGDGPRGWVGTLADITAEAGVEAALSDARDKATEASQLKSDFLANMSHEIRTPMNAVIGMTDLLLETDLDVRQRDYAQTVRNSGEALLSIISDILDFSKIEAGKLDVETIEFNLRNTVDSVADLLGGQAFAKGLELIVDVAPDLPETVEGDPGRLRQVLTNLIGNAIKFTRAGEVVVRVRADVVDAAQHSVRFDVSDTGDGISADKLDVVFQPFVQADTSTSRRYGGTGLGLAISAELVALMGGNCGVTSRVDVGSNFWFTILARADACNAAPVVTSDPDLTGVRILVADDNHSQLSVLSGRLAGWGMAVTTADSASIALDRIHSAAAAGSPFAVALIDQHLPPVAGGTLIDAIAADATMVTRLILMGDAGHAQDCSELTTSAVYGSIRKPIHLQGLRDCVRMALGLGAVDAVSAETPVPRRQAIRDGDAGHLLLAEDNLVNQKVAVAMLSSGGYRVDTVLTGAAAVEASAARSYDAILMDCQMPEMNGYEATAAIRAREGSDAHTLIIALTAGAQSRDREQCLAAGMDGYLSKPVTKEALLSKVGRSIAVGGQRDVPAQPAPSTTVPVIDDVVFGKLLALAGRAGPDFLSTLIDSFLSTTAVLLTQLADALDHLDVDAAGGIAHTIKGSCSQLGGVGLARACGQMEDAATAGELPELRVAFSTAQADFHHLRLALTGELATVQAERTSAARELSGRFT